MLLQSSKTQDKQSCLSRMGAEAENWQQRFVHKDKHKGVVEEAHRVDVSLCGFGVDPLSTVCWVSVRKLCLVL